MWRYAIITVNVARDMRAGGDFMKTSTEIHSAARLVGEERAIELIAGAGFDAWDFSMFDMVKYLWHEDYITASEHPLYGPQYREFAKRLRNVGEECGIRCNQSHAPFSFAWADENNCKLITSKEMQEINDKRKIIYERKSLQKLKAP